MKMNSSQICNTRPSAFDVKSGMVSFMCSFRWFCCGVIISALGANAFANPHGMTVHSGSANAHTSGSTLTINTSQNAVLNWQSFNIAAGESTIFNQPNAYSLVVNNIHDANASQIYGSLQANGMVVLMNPSGFYFGPTAFVKTGGLIVSTAGSYVPPQNTGGSWEFNGPPPMASIINYGQIEVGRHGSVFLIADTIENDGVISAPGGSIGLASGQTVMLSERPDGRGLSMNVTLPQGSVDNNGKLIADAGVISMQAQVVNQNGLVQANSVVNDNGTIELVAADTLNLGPNSQITANGDNSTPGSSGGNIILDSGNDFIDAVGSQVSAAGGALGGNGGNIEICAPNFLSFNSKFDASAQNGWTAGNLFLDPNSIQLDNNSSDTGSAGTGTVLAGDPPAGTLDLDVNTAFNGFSQILLQASQDITLAGNTTWNLSQSTGNNSGQLTLEAGRNIIFGDNSLLTDANGWSVNLSAGFNFGTGSVMPGTGSLFINNQGSTGGSIQMGSGAINLTAGKNITVGSGAVITTAGGSIYAHALSGSINTGSDAEGYYFNSSASSLATAYDLSHGLGGISTEAGGDVTLIAGLNITSVLPGRNGSSGNGYYYNGNFVSDGSDGRQTAGAGAYGRTEAGNVTIVAGGTVTGNYVVADGTGNIFAGVKMDANGNPVTDAAGHYVLGNTGSAGGTAGSPSLSLDLINGGWNVTAQNIYLQGVFNPNGAYDIVGGPALNHTFDYAPGSYVNLTAENEVQLGASSSSLWLAGSVLPFIYPGILNIQSGAAGVALGISGSPTSLILYPSPQGSLTVNTTGNLFGNLTSLSSPSPQIFSLIVSDSGADQWKNVSSFSANDHAATPIHEDDPTPIDVNVGGDMDLVALSVPEAAQINVTGNMNNCGFQGMNLAANDVTSIHVGGNINNASGFTTVNLNNVVGSSVPDFSVLGQAITAPGQPSAATLASSFFYDPGTGVLTYRAIPGQKLANLLALLQKLTIQVYKNGIPQWADPPFDTIPITRTVSVLNGSDASALLAQAAIAGAVPVNDAVAGFVLGGGGKFNISANNIDLGTTAGIESAGVGLYKVGNAYPLASLFGNGGVFDRGADISVTAQGDLTMFSSSIASLNGGDISVDAGGTISLGSSQFTVPTFGARGIYTTSGGDISAIAGSDLDVNGSRLATYNGGNITAESLNGNINVGSGASTPVSITAFYEDPSSHTVYSDSPQPPFSGIIALTFDGTDKNFPAPAPELGNILVEAPNGSINANVAGILQVPLNHKDYPNAVTAVFAGSELRDANGNPLTAADLGTPSIQGSLATAAANDQPQTVVVGGQRIQVSAAVWGELSSMLGLSPDANQVIQLDVSGNQGGLIAALNGNGNGNGFAGFSFATQFSPGQDINALGSGIIASNARLGASGNINGLVFARNNIDITAQQNVNVTALGVGNVNVAGTSISGTIIGVGAVNVSGASIDASLQSANVSGGTSGSSGLGNANVAGAAATGASASSDSAVKQVASDNTEESDDEKKKRGSGGQSGIVRRTGRVTVILPKAQG